MSDFDIGGVNFGVADQALSRGQRPVDDGRGIDAGVDRILDKSDEVSATLEDTRSAFSKEIARGVLSQALGFQVRSPEEVQLDNLRNELAQVRFQEQISTGMVTQTFSRMLSSADELNASPEMQELGVTVDAALLRDRPHDFVKAAQAMGFPIDLGTLNQGGFNIATPQEQADQAAQTTLRRRETTLAAVETTGKLAELSDDFAAGKGVLFDLIENEAEVEGQATGQDIIPGFDDTDFDEDAGSAAFLRTLPRMFRVAQGAGVDPKVAAGMIIDSPFGEELKGVLESAPRDDDGRIVLGEGDSDATSRSIFNTVVSMIQMANRASSNLTEFQNTIDDFSRRLGANGVDFPSFRAFAESEAARLGATLEQFGKSLGLGAVFDEGG